MPAAPFFSMGPFRALIDLQDRSEPGSGVVEIDAHGVDELVVGTFLHHVDQSLLPWRLACENRISIKIIEIFGDGDGL
jgi:hypothetical protein